VLLLLFSSPTSARDGATAGTFPLRDAAGLVPIGVAIDAVEHRGHPAVRLRGAPDIAGPQLAMLPGITFGDGTIEARVAGQPMAGAAESARGFVGVAFRVGPGGERFECFYLRPTNGRAEDQLRRNHATQYVAHPDFPWHRLRAEAPGVYESYVDLVPGEWTELRIEVEGTRARLFVHGAAQPTLIVNDLKLGAGAGGVALWIGPGTEAWFRDVTVTPR
jgi:hypothetical protein